MVRTKQNLFIMRDNIVIFNKIYLLVNENSTHGMFVIYFIKCFFKYYKEQRVKLTDIFY